jgi:hypothetical protein
MEKTFYLQRANLIDKAVKSLIVRPNEEMESYELMTNTII